MQQFRSHWEWGIGNGELGMGHRALAKQGIGHRALGIGNTVNCQLSTVNCQLSTVN
ncbi:hypothetical protein [Microcoleus anatoxicus]|uniref:hypothetical protein n=1 Tax=Microcoleus anatoxicus TaxID=2705319 RepID=UPI0030C96E29